MSYTKVGKACGTCSVCGRKICKDRPENIGYCNCYKYCPLCGKLMTPYTPDLGKAYNSDRGLEVLFICLEHTPPYYSKQQPTEVELE